MGTILGRLPGNFIHELPQIKTISGLRCTARRHTSTPDPSPYMPVGEWALPRLMRGILSVPITSSRAKRDSPRQESTFRQAIRGGARHTALN